MQLVVCEAQYARINYSNFVFAPLPLLKIAPHQWGRKPNCSQASVGTNHPLDYPMLFLLGLFRARLMIILSRYDPAKYRTFNGWPHNNAEYVFIYLL